MFSLFSRCDIDECFAALQIGIGNLFALISSNGTHPFVIVKILVLTILHKQFIELKMLLDTLSDTEQFSAQSDSDSSARLFTPTSSHGRTPNEMLSNSFKTRCRRKNVKSTRSLSFEYLGISHRLSDILFKEEVEIAFVSRDRIQSRIINVMQISISTSL